jgi:hypothetical protein
MTSEAEMSVHLLLSGKRPHENEIESFAVMLFTDTLYADLSRPVVLLLVVAAISAQKHKNLLLNDFCGLQSRCA